MSALDGSGRGSVVIQWLIRNSGAPSGPRFGRAARVELARVGELRDAGERERRLLREPVVDELVPRRRARLVLGEHDEPPVAVDQLAQRRPVAARRRRVDLVGEPGALHGADEVGRRHVVLVDHDDDLAGMGDEERVEVVERVGERRGAELAQRVAQVHAALALAAEAEPLADPQRGGDRLVAHAVLAAPSATSVSVSSVRTRPFGSRSA